MNADFWQGMCAFPAVGLIAYGTAHILLAAWDAWEKLLKRTAPKWYPKHTNIDVGTAIATYSGRVLRLTFPGGGVFILTDRGRVASRDVRFRAHRAIREAMKETTRDDR